MSDHLSKQRLKQYLERLEEYSLPNSNDRRHAQYVKYINAFLSHFGRECVFLGGSTAENLKLRWSKDGSDADFLLCSGRLEVPVTDLEFRKDTPCFIWVKVAQKEVGSNIKLIENKYLPSDVLRHVDPELFTILRGIYLLITCSTDYIPGRESTVTTTGIESKVGLARTEYRNLKVEGNVLPRKRQLHKKEVLKRDAEFQQYLDKKRREVPCNQHDTEGIEKLLRLIATTRSEGSSGSNFGQWHHFACVTDLVIKRRKQDHLQENAASNIQARYKREETDTEEYENDLDSFPENSDAEGSRSGAKRKHSAENVSGKLRATYTEKTCKDFVPAIVIKGILPCMEDWKKAQHRWLSEEQINEIYHMDVLFVARYAPVNPSSKDFCLSFTRGEKKLAECMSPTQRQLVLIMKAYLKGVFIRYHKEQRRELKLTTFHVKTIIYRVSDIEDPAIWTDDHVLTALGIVLKYLKDALMKKELLHYFIPSNLFMGFEDEDFNALLTCTRIIQDDPVGSIQPFFDLEDGARAEVWLTEEEVLDIEKLASDGGLSNEVDKMEEAMIEFQRGFNEGPRNEEGKAPIQQAMDAAWQMFLEDEATRKLQEVEKKQNLPPGTARSLAPVLTNALSGLFSNPEGEALMGTLSQFLGNSSSSREENRRAEDKFKYLANSYFLGRKPE